MKQNNKPKGPKPGVKATLKILLKIAAKEKSALFAVYLLSLVAEVCNTLLPVILPKYIIEFLMAIVQGIPYDEVSHKLLWTVGLLIGSNFLCSSLNNVAGAIRNSFSEWVQPTFGTEYI